MRGDGVDHGGPHRGRVEALPDPVQGHVVVSRAAGVHRGVQDHALLQRGCRERVLQPLRGQGAVLVGELERGHRRRGVRCGGPGRLLGCGEVGQDPAQALTPVQHLQCHGDALLLGGGRGFDAQQGVAALCEEGLVRAHVLRRDSQRLREHLRESFGQRRVCCCPAARRARCVTARALHRSSVVRCLPLRRSAGGSVVAGSGAPLAAEPVLAPGRRRG